MPPTLSLIREKYLAPENKVFYLSLKISYSILRIYSHTKWSEKRWDNTY